MQKPEGVGWKEAGGEEIITFLGRRGAEARRTARERCSPFVRPHRSSEALVLLRLRLTGGPDLGAACAPQVVRGLGQLRGGLLEVEVAHQLKRGSRRVPQGQRRGWTGLEHGAGPRAATLSLSRCPCSAPHPSTHVARLLRIHTDLAPSRSDKWVQVQHACQSRARFSPLSLVQVGDEAAEALLCNHHGEFLDVL